MMPVFHPSTDTSKKRPCKMISKYTNGLCSKVESDHKSHFTILYILSCRYLSHDSNESHKNLLQFFSLRNKSNSTQSWVQSKECCITVGFTFTSIIWFSIVSASGLFFIRFRFFCWFFPPLFLIFLLFTRWRFFLGCTFFLRTLFFICWCRIGRRSSYIFVNESNTLLSKIHWRTWMTRVEVVTMEVDRWCGPDFSV